MGDSRPFEVRFWEKVSPEPNTGCWLWMGSVGNGGYGVIQVDKKQIRAHRAAWLLMRGPVPDGLLVCHRCDNPLCVNVESHCFLGTAKENAEDCKAKGRLGKRGMDRGWWDANPGRAPRGERNGQAKLTRLAVIEIRYRYAAGETMAGLAQAFTVGYGTVWAIIRGDNWAWAGGPIDPRTRGGGRAPRSTRVHSS